jgi:hypothetical protein
MPERRFLVGLTHPQNQQAGLAAHLTRDAGSWSPTLRAVEKKDASKEVPGKDTMGARQCSDVSMHRPPTIVISDVLHHGGMVRFIQALKTGYII